MTRLALVRRAILSQRLPGLGGLPWALLGLVVAFLLRLAIDKFVQGVPFLTFFPAVLVISVLLGSRWGVAALVVSTVLANYAFQPPFLAFALQPEQLVSSVAFLIAGGLVVAASEALRRAAAEIDEAARRESELTLELQHRVNNNLAMVQSLAAQCARLEQEPKAFIAAFSARLFALSEANKVLSGAGWEASPLPRLAEAALKPFAPGQIDVQGPACTLPPVSCVPLALILHELATNAIKHGALSIPQGRVSLDWTVEQSICRMTWREDGGPAVAEPTRRGMGSRLLRQQSGISELQVDYQPEGLVCRIAVEDSSLI